MYQPPPPYLESDAPARIHRRQQSAWELGLIFSGLGSTAALAIWLTAGASSSLLLVASVIPNLLGIAVGCLFGGLALRGAEVVSDQRGRLAALRAEARPGPLAPPTPGPARSSPVLVVDLGRVPLSPGTEGPVAGLVLGGLILAGSVVGIGWGLAFDRSIPGLTFGLLFLALGLAVLWMADAFLPPSRLGPSTGRWEGQWTVEGLEAPFYSFAQYRFEDGRYRLPSRIFHQAVAVLDRPNAVPWGLLQVFVYRVPWDAGSEFALAGVGSAVRPWWFKGTRIGTAFLPNVPSAGGWTPPGLPVPIPMALLPGALQTAVDGGAALFVERGCLSPRGREATDALASGFQRTMNQPMRGPVYRPMPRSHSAGELASWIQANPGPP